VIDLLQQIVLAPLASLGKFFVRIGPKLLLVVFVLVVGAISAFLVWRVVAKLLRAAGFDVIAEKLGVGRVLRRGGVTREASELVAVVAGAAIVIATLATAVDRLEIDGASRFVDQVVTDLERGAAGTLLVAAGMIIAQFAAHFADRTARVAGVPFHWAIGEAARFMVIAIVLVDALNAAGVAAPLVTSAFVILFAGVPLLGGALLLVGGRELIASYLSGRAIRGLYEPGDEIAVGELHGVIRRLGPLCVEIRSSGGSEVRVPNRWLAERIVMHRRIADQALSELEDVASAQNVPEYKEQDRQTSGGESESSRERKSL
jgi:hypothetical protein